MVLNANPSEQDPKTALNPIDLPFNPSEQPLSGQETYLLTALEASLHLSRRDMPEFFRQNAFDLRADPKTSTVLLKLASTIEAHLSEDPQLKD